MWCLSQVIVKYPKRERIILFYSLLLTFHGLISVKMKALQSVEIPVATYHSTRPNFLNDLKLQQHHCESVGLLNWQLLTPLAQLIKEENASDELPRCIFIRKSKVIYRRTLLQWLFEIMNNFFFVYCPLFVLFNCLLLEHMHLFPNWVPLCTRGSEYFSANAKK
jgi:hypothetical protein